MPDGYDVDPAILTGTASDILDCITPAEKMSLESISGSASWYGHDDLYQAFGEFGVTWQLATTILGSRSMSAAGTLGAAAQTYAESEDNTQQAFSQMNAAME